jgi:hypothetical protein
VRICVLAACLFVPTFCGWAFGFHQEDWLLSSTTGRSRVHILINSGPDILLGVFFFAKTVVSVIIFQRHATALPLFGILVRQ